MAAPRKIPLPATLTTEHMTEAITARAIHLLKRLSECSRVDSLCDDLMTFDVMKRKGEAFSRTDRSIIASEPFATGACNSRLSFFEFTSVLFYA